MEISPSGKGIHLIAKGRIPKGRKCPLFEIYQGGRYFTMTGDWLEGTPRTVEDRSSEIVVVYQEAFGGSPSIVAKAKKPHPEPAISSNNLHQPNRSTNELALRLERHGDTVIVQGLKGSYSATIGKDGQNRAYFELLTRAVESEYEETRPVLKVLTREFYIARAINQGMLAKDRDALERFQDAAGRFSAVYAENTDSSWSQGQDIALIDQKVRDFADELRKIGIEVRYEGIINGNFVRVSLQPQGFFDVYATRRRRPLEPYAHGFEDLGLQLRIEALWNDFYLCSPISDAALGELRDSADSDGLCPAFTLKS